MDDPPILHLTNPVRLGGRELYAQLKSATPAGPRPPEYAAALDAWDEGRVTPFQMHLHSRIALAVIDHAVADIARQAWNLGHEADPDTLNPWPEDLDEELRRL